MLHSGGHCQAEPSLVQPHFGNFGQVLTTERVQTDCPPTLDVCSFDGFVRAGDASKWVGCQILPRCQWGPALVLVSPQSLAFLLSQSTKITPTLDFCIPQTMSCSSFFFLSSDGFTVLLEVLCTGSDLQTPLPECLGVKSQFLCTREVSGGNTGSWQGLKRDGPLCFQRILCVPQKYFSVLPSTVI